MEILSSLYSICTQDTLFDAVEFQWRYRKNPSALGDTYLSHSFSTYTVAFCTTHGQNNTRKCDTDSFVPVASLNGAIGSPYSFIRYLIGRTREIWSVVYINTKWIYASKTLTCTIRECAIIRNVLHVTLIFPFISWCSGAANAKWTPRAWHSSLNYIEVNCDTASVEILSKFHHPNSSIFTNLDCNISSLSIISSVEVFSMP